MLYFNKILAHSGFAPFLKFFFLAQPAIGVMGVAQFGFGRHFIQADLHAALAARREGAARRRIQQVDRLALDGHQAFLLLGVQLGDGVDQALGVLVLGVVKISSVVPYSTM